MFGQPLQENELYKIHVIKELTEAKIGAVNLNISKEEIFDILFMLLLMWCSDAFYCVF